MCDTEQLSMGSLEKAEAGFKLEMMSLSENEAFARTTVAAFVSRCDPTVEELVEIKTAVSEAVSNAVIHAYPDGPGPIILECRILDGRTLLIRIEDQGIGIEDIEKAREPLYSGLQNEERSGMGFTVMESFMERILVESGPGDGTAITMWKKLDLVYGT